MSNTAAETEEILEPVTEGFSQLVRRVFRRVPMPTEPEPDVTPSWSLCYAEERALDLIAIESSPAGEASAQFWVAI
jgi:hypothetical protein